MYNVPAVARHEEVNVCGSNILTAVTQDNKCYFSPRHVCQALGIDWAGQFNKIKADPVLASTVEEIVMAAADGKNRKMIMMPIEILSGWLFTIKKVRPELQAKLNLYRAETYRALDAWFRQGLRNDPVVQKSTVYNDPKSFTEALRLAAKQILEKEALEAQGALTAPESEAFNAVAS